MKKVICLTVLLFSSVGHATEPETPMIFTFDQDKSSQPPKSFVFEVTGKGPSVKWEVKTDKTAPSTPNILAQVGRAEGGNNFPLAILDGVTVQDGEVSVKFKAVAGQEDQAGGLVWRYRDANNYYVARANALEANYTIYCVKDGKRRSFKSVDLKVTPQAWHALKVIFRQNIFRLHFDGKEVLTATDHTFNQPGRVGLWTKADSVSYFDDFEVKTDDTKAAH
ncbi:MAG: hypothetical protein HY204_02910 [Nitrospirae bacterium]|nr:hypothetical protein [Nitrospirota bacterium]